MASTGDRKHVVLNNHLSVVSYNGGGEKELGIGNVLKKKGPPHCSDKGKNFDLLLEYKVRSTFPFPIVIVFLLAIAHTVPNRIHWSRLLGDHAAVGQLSIARGVHVDVINCECATFFFFRL